MFSEQAKCNYVANIISESFNSWVKDLKELHVAELIDRIRRQIMVTFDKWRMIGKQLNRLILPSVMQELHMKSRKMRKPCISRGDTCAEVSGADMDGKAWRYAVELDKCECTCREWQITGKPCTHAIAFICSIKGARLEEYEHEYYSVENFRRAYEGVIRRITMAEV